MQRNARLTTVRGMPRAAVFAWVVLASWVVQVTLASWASPAVAQTRGTSETKLKPCRLTGVSHEVLCGTVQRPLDPIQLPKQQPTKGRSIDVHFAVLPALARNKLPDPIFVFVGGPGQSAMALAGPLSGLLARAANRRDIVLIDQRGTGRSAPLHCAEETPTRPLAEVADGARQLQALDICRQRLTLLPHGDLRFYTTTIAMQDADAVRAALGAEQVNLLGASYGTRAVLEYMRQFPNRVRRAVLDGVAPPDMVLPASFSADNQAALDALFQSCVSDETCNLRYPYFRNQWHGMLASLPREVLLTHPVTGQPERVRLTREGVLSLVRQPLYAPPLASALPWAVAEAAQGRFDALMGLGLSLGAGRRSQAVSQGMHFSVVCAEDGPRLNGRLDAPGADFADSFVDLYRRVCATWPRGVVPAAFYTVPPTQTPSLLLSGGIDPATPARHGERVAAALGPKARHVVVANAGHGVMSLGCMRDVIFRFIAAADDAAAAAVETGCARSLPRPAAFRMPTPPATQAKGPP